MVLAPEATLRDGRYRLERKLGTGGMASVWLAHDTRLDRPVAVKVLSDTLAMDEEFVVRFRREARVAAQLSHPNLVRLYDFGTEEERPFLVSEWIDGPDLHEMRRDRKPVDAEALAADLLSALDYIHRAGIIHRDVKPSNVLIGRRDGRARLTDFGIAQPEDATRLTETGMVMGTASYIAPEVLRGERSSAQSDLYAAGVVLSREVETGGSPVVRRLVNWLTAEEPGARPHSAAEALELVEDVRRTPTRRTAETAELAEASEEEPETAEATVSTPLEREEAPRAEPWPASRAEPLPAPGEFVPEPYHRSRLGPRVLAVLGALLAVGAVAALAIALVGGGSEGGEGTEVQQAASGDGGGGGGRQEEAAPAGEETGGSAVPPASDTPNPAAGAALNDRGFEVLQSGDPEAAIPILQRAVASFPEGSTDLEYGYALYNLGDALVQAERPEEAIPILEARLQIPDQLPEVQAKLEEARAAAEE